MDRDEANWGREGKTCPPPLFSEREKRIPRAFPLDRAPVHAPPLVTELLSWSHDRYVRSLTPIEQK